MAGMSGDAFMSRMLRPTYVVRMAARDDGGDSPRARGARTSKARAMAEIDQLVLERASTLTGLDLVNLPRDPEQF